MGMKLFMYKNGLRNACGRKIREERRKQKLTQTDLANLLKKQSVFLDQKAISRIELQERIVTDYELMAFAETLQVNVVDLWDI